MLVSESASVLGAKRLERIELQRQHRLDAETHLEEREQTERLQRQLVLQSQLALYLEQKV